jgi:hypothetical protein
VSAYEGDDIDSHFLTAEEVEIRPLVSEAEESLELCRDAVAALESFLSEAWFSGVRAGHSQMLTRATERKVPFGAIDMRPVETEFRALMERCAEELNLTVARTVDAWDLLGRAWIAGARSFQAEIAARLLEGGSDVAKEALEWLDEDPQR